MKAPASPQKLSRDLRLMILFGALRTISDLFLNTFFVSFIMQIATNEIVSVGLYNLFHYVAICAAFFLFANMVKRHNKVAVLRLNLVPKILLLIMIICLGDRVAEYMIPLGILYGISAGLYHLPMNAMLSEKATSAMLSRYTGENAATKHLVKIIAPLVLGSLITIGSYVEMAWALLAVVVAELVATFFVSSSRHRSKRPVDFAGFFKCMMRFPVIRKVFFQEILRGFSISGALGTVITMYTVYMFHTDMNLGIYTTICAICTILVCWCMGRYVRPAKYRQILYLAIPVISVTMGAFVWKTTPLMFIVYSFMNATVIQAVDQICSVHAHKLSKSRCVTVDYRVEYFVFRDTALFIGRWAAYVGLLYIGIFGGYEWLRWYLALITLTIIGAGIIAARLSHREG